MPEDNLVSLRHYINAFGEEACAAERPRSLLAIILRLIGISGAVWGVLKRLYCPLVFRPAVHNLDTERPNQELHIRNNSMPTIQEGGLFLYFTLSALFVGSTCFDIYYCVSQ